MPVPNTMQDLQQLAGSNSPQGTEAIGNSLDNYIRAVSAILRSTNALSSATISAASTTDIATSDAESVQVTGSATITSLGTGFNGCIREVRFIGVCTLVASSSIVMPASANVVTSAGDTLRFRCVAAGQWILVGSSRPTVQGLNGISPFCVTLLDDVDAATARATLGAQSALGYTPVNAAGDTITGNLNVNGTLTVSNPIQSTGANAAINFQDRTGSGVWSWYVTSSSARLFNGVNDIVTVGPSGDMSSRTATASGGLALQGNTSGLGANEHLINFFSNRWLTFSQTLDRFQFGNAPLEVLNAGITAQSINVGAGFTVTKFSVSSAAPGALAQGEIYFQTT